VLLLDGIDEAGRASDEIKRHVAEVLAPQGHVLIVTSRPNGVSKELFSTKGYDHFELRPFTPGQQTEVVERRLICAVGDKSGQKRAATLMRYINTKVPIDADTGDRVKRNPLVLSMVISIFELRQAAAAEVGASGRVETSSRRARTVTEVDFSRNPMCLPDPKVPKDGESQPYDGLLEIARAIAVCPMILGECY
jgi:hypothetical protein